MTRLTLLHTNDLHGRMEAMSRIATLARRVRAEVEAKGGYVALWDAGDAEDPALFESSMTRGSAVMGALRGAGYELEALGNASPIRYGPEVIADLARRFGRPLLCANMLDSRTHKLYPGLIPYTLKRYRDITVGVIGMTAVMGIYSFFPVEFPDTAALVRDLVALVRSEGAQIVVLLSHLGSPVDEQMAREVDGLDVILGGHDHRMLYPPLEVNGTLIAQAGEYGRFLGRLDLDIDPVAGKIERWRGEALPVDESLPPDPAMLAAWETERARVRALSERVVGELLDPLDWAEDRECAAGDFTADVLLDHVQGAEVALVVAGHWRSGLDAGLVHWSDLVGAIRSSANPARADVTGAQIIQLLERALLSENASCRPRPLRGIAVGWPHVAGMEVRWNPAARQVVSATVQGAPLERERRYVLATTDLEVSDLLGYLPLPDREYALEVPIILPELADAYLRQHSPLHAPQGRRILDSVENINYTL